MTLLPEQLEDAGTYPLITQELLDRGNEEEAIRQVMGLNALRALRDAQRVAEGMR